MDFLKTIDEKFVHENFKDKAVAESIIKQHNLRYKIIVAMMTSFILVSCIAIGYALTKTSAAQTAERQLIITKQQTDSCIMSAYNYQKLAEENRKAMEAKHRAIQQQLEDCSKSKKK